MEKDYDIENTWWYNFFQTIGLNSYDIEYADYMRANGITPKEAARLITL